MTELWFDGYNMNPAEIKKEVGINALVKAGRKEVFPTIEIDSKKYRRLDFSLIPDFGFLGSEDPLAKNVELKLSFDRELAIMSVMDYASQSTDDHKILEKPFVIKDCHSVTEYISSPDLRLQYETIQNSPLMYNYDESEVIIRTLAQNETTLRLDAIHGGPLPSHLFAGVISCDALHGTKEKTCTAFTQNNVEEVNIKVNGHSVNGYPVKCEEGCSTYPLIKWLESTNRLHNNLAGRTFTLDTFKDNFIWSHHFESEESVNGWVSIDLKLSQAYETNMCLVIWLITPYTLSLDKYNQIEKIKV